VGTRKGEMSVNVVYFVSIYENRRIKPVEIVLRGDGGGKRKNDRGSKSRYI
jgi:hypothetical protein